jgi:hypothetical protein
MRYDLAQDATRQATSGEQLVVGLLGPWLFKRGPRQGLAVYERRGAAHGKLESTVTIGELSKIAKRGRFAILLQDRNAGEERVA